MPDRKGAEPSLARPGSSGAGSARSDRAIVVGVSLSGSHVPEISWAANWAVRSTRALRLLCCLPPEAMSLPDRQVVRQRQTKLLHNLASWLRNDHPGLDVAVDIVDADPNRMLLRAGAKGHPIVIGTGSAHGTASRFSPTVAAVVPTYNQGPATVLVGDGSGNAKGPILILDQDRAPAATEFAQMLSSDLGVSSEVVAGWTDKRGHPHVDRMRAATAKASLLVISTVPAKNLREAAKPRRERSLARLAACPVAVVADTP